MTTTGWPRRIRGGAIQVPPYNEFVRQEDGSLLPVGIIAEFQMAVLDSMNVSCEVVMGDLFGQRLPNGTYTGYFGKMQRKELDMGFFGYPLEADMLADFHTVPVFRFDPMSIVSGVARPYVEDDSGIINAFGPNVWLAILLSWIGVTLVTWFLYRYQQRETKVTSKPGIERLFLSYFEMLLKNATAVSPSSTATRLVFLSWSLSCLFLASLLSATAKGSLMIQVPSARIDSAADVLRQPEPPTPLVVKETLLEVILRESPREDFRALHALVVKGKGYVSIEELFSRRTYDRLMDGGAVQLSNELFTLEHSAVACSHKSRRFYVGKTAICLLWSTWYSRKDLHPNFLRAMSKRTRWLAESGTPFYRERQHLSKTRGCLVSPDMNRRHVQHSDLTLRDVRAAFVIYAILTSVAITVFVAEVVLRRRR